MAKKIQTKKLSPPRPTHPEVQGFFLIALGLFATISLLSFAYQAPQKNWLGILGYLTAFGSEYLFGWGAYLMPCYLIWLGSRFLLRGKLNYLAYDHFYFAMLLASSCLLLTVFADLFPDHCFGDLCRESPLYAHRRALQFRRRSLLLSLLRSALLVPAARLESDWHDADRLERGACLVFAADAGAAARQSKTAGRSSWKTLCNSADSLETDEEMAHRYI